MTVMEFTPISRYNGAIPYPGGCQPDGVWVGPVDVAGLSGDGLRGRLGEIGRAESKLGAMKSQVLAELSRRNDAAAAERVARDVLQSSKRNAQRDVEAA